MDSYCLKNKIQSFCDFDFDETRTMCENSSKQSVKNCFPKMCNQSQSDDIFSVARNRETFDLDEDSFLDRILTEVPIENYTQSSDRNSGLHLKSTSSHQNNFR